MPPLRSQRRNRRARAPKVRRRRNLTKFVPSADSDFAMTSRNFARYVWEHRDELGICERDAEYMSRLVRQFRAKLSIATNPATRTSPAIKGKNAARKDAEQWVRMIGEKIRGDHEIEQQHKLILRVVGLASRKKTSACPQRPPVLQFIGTGDGVDGAVGAGNGSGVHVLKFYDMQTDITKADCGVIRRSKPDGASGIELWAGFIPEGMYVPRSPQEYVQLGYGWPLFLRKFVASPVEARVPMPDRPMLIVYWARWVNQAGDQGRYCATCIGRVEGWPKVTGQRPAELPASQVSIEDGAKYALPAAGSQTARAQIPGAGEQQVPGVQATFLLVGTPLELPADACGVDSGVEMVAVEQRTLPAGA